MRVTILNGSARIAKGVTGRLVSGMIAGLTRGGAEVSCFAVASLRISPCTACLACMHATPGTCSIKDEMRDIYRALKESDCLVMATPVYLDNMSAQLKTVIDRSMCCMRPFLAKDRAGRVRHDFAWHMPPKFLLISTSGFPERETFDPLIATFRAQAANFDAEPIGELCIPGSIALQMEPHLLDRYLGLLEETGSAIASTGVITEELIREINTPPVDAEEYLRISAKYEAWCREQMNKCRISVRGFAD